MGRRDRGPRKGGLVRMGIRSLAGGIGLASESIKARKDSQTPMTEELEHGSIPRTNSERGDNPDPDVDAFEGPPPSYSFGPEDSKSGHDQYPEEKVGHSQSSDEKAGHSQYPNEHVGGETEETLEEEWNLDDAQDDIIGGYSEKSPVREASELEHTFIRNHPPPNYTQAEGKLTLPVVIPQRRPGGRSRGFVRAYAPMLENCGIDQATWLDFLDTFQKSSAANPWLNAINMAGIATIWIPSHGVGIAVGYAIQQITNIAIELQGRERTNNFLHKINEDFFRPRGLYCLVMTWNPESTRRVEQVNITATIASRSSPNTGVSGLTSKYRSSDGNTYGEWEFPEVAPLVFPALDQMAAQTSADGIKEKTKFVKGYTFVAKYWDKRATAEYAMKNPNSVLAQVPKEKFNSRYADPNNPAASGSLISFVSGGRLIPGPSSRGLVGGIASVVGQTVRGEKQGSEWNKYSNEQHSNAQYQYQEGRDYDRRSRRQDRRHRGGKVGIVSTPVGIYNKLLKKNVLYLMVVNMPSTEEMAANKAAI